MQRLHGWMTLVAVSSMAALSTAACGDDPETGGPGGQGGAVVAAGELSVLYEAPGGVVEGATVTLSGPGDMTQELTTDAAGRVTFSGLDWSRGTAAITAHKAGLMPALQSRVGVTEADGLVTIRAWTDDLDGPDMVEVSGHASGMVDEWHYLLVSSTATASSIWQSTGPDYGLQVPAGEAMELVLLEFDSPGEPTSDQGTSQIFYQWAVAEAGPFDADTTYDVDLDAMTVAPTSVTGSFLLPPRQDSPLRSEGQGYLMVMSRSDLLSSYAGFSTWIDLSADGSAFEFEAEYIEVAGIPEPTTYYRVRTADGESWALVDGNPQPGPIDPQMVDIPEMLAPAAPGAPHSIHEPIRWQAFDEDLYVELRIMHGQEVLWDLVAPIDASELAIPPLPASLPADYLAGPLSAALLFVRASDVTTHDPINEHGAAVVFDLTK